MSAYFTLYQPTDRNNLQFEDEPIFTAQPGSSGYYQKDAVLGMMCENNEV